MKNIKIQHIIQRYLNEQHLFTDNSANPDTTVGDRIEVIGLAPRSGWKFRIVGEKNIISNFRADVVDRRAVENGAAAGFLIVATTKDKEQQKLNDKDLFWSIADLAKQSNVIKQYYDNTNYQFVVSSPIVNRKRKKTFNVWIIDISETSAYGQLLSIIERLYKQDPLDLIVYVPNLKFRESVIQQSKITTQQMVIFQTNELKRFIKTLKQTKPELYNNIFPRGARSEKILNSIPNFEQLDKQFEDLPPDIKTGQIVDIDEIEYIGKGRYDIDPITGLTRIVPISGMIKSGLYLYDLFTRQGVEFIGQIKDELPVSGIIELPGDYIRSVRSKFDGTLKAQKTAEGEIEAWFESGKLYLRNETDEEYAYFESSTTNGFSKNGDYLNGTWWERKSPTDPYEKVGIEINGKYRKAPKELTYPYTTPKNGIFYTTNQSPSYVYNYNLVDKQWDRYDKNKFENWLNYGEGAEELYDSRIIETDPNILNNLDQQAGTTSKKSFQIKDELQKIDLFKKEGNTFKRKATYTINPPAATKYLPDANGRSGNYVSAFFKSGNEYVDFWIQKSDLKE